MAEFNANEGLLTFIFKKSGRFKEINKNKIHNVRLDYFPDKIYDEFVLEEKKVDLKEEKRKLQREKVFTYLYGYPKYDYCKKFKLEDTIEEESFNKRFNSNELRWVLWKENDKTTKFLDSIKRRVINQSNIIIVIYGTPNSGKSEVSQTIAKYITYLFGKLRNEEIKTHIAFSTGEFNIILRNMKVGDVAIRDESPELSGTGARTAKKNLDNVTKITRMNQNSFIFVNPVELNVDVTSFYLEMAGKYEKERISRCILKDKNGEYVGHIYIPLHNDEEFRQEYLRKKQENIENLLDYSGHVGVEFDNERFEIDFKKIINHCKENEIFIKGEIEAEIYIMNNEIKGDTKYIEILTSKVYGQMKRLKRGIDYIKEIDEVEPEKKIIMDELELENPEQNDDKKIEFDFKITEEELFKTIKKEVKWRDKERDIKIYKKREKGIMLEELSKEYNIDESTISYTSSKVKGKINYYKGKLFEKKYYEYLKSLNRFDKVELDGDSGKPDIYAYDEKNNILHIFSLKYYEIKTRPYYVNVKDFMSELKFAYDNQLDYDDIIVKLIIYDLLTDKIEERILDFRNPKAVKLE